MTIIDLTIATSQPEFYANRNWKTMESHQCKTKTDSHSLSNVTQILNLLETNQTIIRDISAHDSLQKMLNLVTIFVNTID